MLFRSRGCLSTGYTNIALAHLRRMKLVPLPSGPVAVGCLSGAKEETITACIGRMVAWSNLVSEVCKTEFLDHELLGYFDVFRLVSYGPQQQQQQDRAQHTSSQLDLEKRLHRLAEVFKLDGIALVDQFKEHRRLAQTRLSNNPGEPAVVAWQQALRLTQATSRRRHQFQAIPLVDRKSTRLNSSH